MNIREKGAHVIVHLLSDRLRGQSEHATVLFPINRGKSMICALHNGMTVKVPVGNGSSKWSWPSSSNRKWR